MTSFANSPKSSAPQGRSIGSLLAMTVGALMLVSTVYLVPVGSAQAQSASPQPPCENLFSVRYLA